MKKIMVIIGEASGDLHGGHVLHNLLQLQPDLELFGTGGKLFQDCQAKVYHHVEELAVIGFWEVLKKYHYFKKVLNQMIELLDKNRPDLLFLVDYPGFNLRLAKEAKKRGIPVIYYIAPQVWAWKKGRILQIQKYVDHMIVLFPFEVDFFHQFNIKAHCFGHPLLEITKVTQSKAEVFNCYQLNPQQRLISLLPGSRSYEVKKHLPLLLKAAAMMFKKSPDLQFVWPMASTIAKGDYCRMIKKVAFPLTLIENDTYNVVGASDFAIVASGSATLETAILETPELIFYQTSLPTYLIGHYLLKLKTIGLPNIIAQKKIIPEIVTKKISAKKLAQKTLSVMNNPTCYQQIKADMQILKQKLGGQNAYQKTAEFINQFFKKK